LRAGPGEISCLPSQSERRVSIYFCANEIVNS
jgi:hypothetical protein